MPTLLKIILPFSEDLSLSTFAQVFGSDAVSREIITSSQKLHYEELPHFGKRLMCLHLSDVLEREEYISLCAAWLPGAHCFHSSPLACMFTQVFKFHNDNQTVDHRHGGRESERDRMSPAVACFNCEHYTDSGGIPEVQL